MIDSRISARLIAGLAVASFGITPAFAQMNKNMPASAMSHSSGAEQAQPRPAHMNPAHKHAGHKHGSHKGSPAAKGK